jgi:hypothetical protein
MTYTLTLTQEQIQVIAAGLENLPFKVAAPVINDLQRQIADQRKPQAVADAAE